MKKKLKPRGMLKPESELPGHSPKLPGRPPGSKNTPKDLAGQLEAEAMQTVKSLSQVRRVLQKSLEALQAAQEIEPELVINKDYIESTLQCTTGLSRCLSEIIKAIKYLREAPLDQSLAVEQDTNRILKELGLGSP